MIYNRKKIKSQFFISDDIDAASEFVPLITDEEYEDAENKKSDYPEELPLLPLRNTVLFPGVVIPIAIGRDKSISLIKDVYRKNKLLGAVAQKVAEMEDPEGDDLNIVGTIGYILKILEMPDNSTTVIIQGKKKFEIKEMITDEPYFIARTKVIEEVGAPSKSPEFDAVVSSLKDLSIRIIQLSHSAPPEATFAIKNIESPEFLINYICSNTEVSGTEKQELLEINDISIRAIKLLEILAKEVQQLQLKNDIQAKVKIEIDQQQREYFLNQQIKTIQDELGGNPFDVEIEELKNKSKRKKWSKETKQNFEKELEKLNRINPASPDYSNQLNYLQLLLELPWNEYTKDNFDLKRAQKILDKEHFGLDKVKDRIIEYLAVLKLKGDLKSPIICLYGPPGVGKTSLGRSVANALGRKYVRMSLGGVHDEAEIRGHRKTYIGAMPGRIIQSIKKAKSSNPVFILDEIDKVGNDFRGDPSSALLEVLDPEQNVTFYDNYLEMEFDLSKVMFVATANSLSTIKPALLDRMELIEISGYIIEEKIEIAHQHLIPKQLTNHGVKKTQLVFSKKVLEYLVENYTRESGVRELDKTIASVVRMIAKRIAMDEPVSKNLSIDDLIVILGPAKYSKDKYENNNFAGVVTGLAVTSVGGEILFVETSVSKGSGSKLTLTGNLGTVMKESAVLALEYIKSNAERLQIPYSVFETWNVHVHVPEGAIPKDGPSAGITMVTSMASAFTQRKVKNHLAMTGEITLRGKVLPVGGIKEKILAAKRANITEIIMSKDNEKDVRQIKDIYIEGLTFHFVSLVEEVLAIALLDEKIPNALVVE